MATSSLSSLRWPSLTSLAYSLIAVAICFGLIGLLLTGSGRIVVSVTVTILLISIALVNIRLAIPAAFVYLFVLGDLRRLLMPWFGWSGKDPLLLVGSVFALILFANALVRRTVRFDTPLAKWMLALMAIMALQILNPKQGGFIVGIAGAMFMLIPLVWFWVGRTYVTPQIMRILLLKVFLPFAVLAALYGNYHVFYGYLPHQQLWLEQNYYAGLGDPNNPAPISFFASNTEYGYTLILGAIISWAAFLRGYRPLILLVPFFLGSIMLTGSRGGLFFAPFMLAVMWSILSRSKSTWIIRGGIALFVAALGVFWSVSQATQLNLDSSVEGRLNRQAQEYVHAPTGQGEGSSALVHFQMMLGGYSHVLKEPLGLGIGSVTKAAGRFGGRGYSTETPFGNSFVALGLPGGLLYHIVVALVVIAAFRYWIARRNFIGLAIFGILGATMANLMAGGLYAIGPLVALCAGALDRFANYSEELSSNG